ncbi:hypothetical protein ElyMa_002366900 [Elysia marginata]|uniref:Uncharacterized protein n=1 Tax=Elysia marginata TaxID=1093978 RepID=A0AAV4GC36_9GAST|nr:hypothetical protein ElyMa_002366900 [Elysia marginata]
MHTENRVKASRSTFANKIKQRQKHASILRRRRARAYLSALWLSGKTLAQRSGVNYEVISETALWTIESVLPLCDVRSACVHQNQSHYPDTGPTSHNIKSIMSDTRRITC